MTNKEKYKTADERENAFLEFCSLSSCGVKCPCYNTRQNNCSPFRWLELEDEEEKPRPCPFCGGKASAIEVLNYNATAVRCDYCRATSGNFGTKEEAITAWNRRANNG